MKEQSVISELKYINSNCEFSSKCSKDRQEFLLSSGLVDYFDGTLMLTNGGELAMGYTPEQIGMTNDTEEDETECFFYLNEDHND